jgi:hypothetical protein
MFDVSDSSRSEIGVVSWNCELELKRRNENETANAELEIKRSNFEDEFENWINVWN